MNTERLQRRVWFFSHYYFVILFFILRSHLLEKNTPGRNIVKTLEKKNTASAFRVVPTIKVVLVYYCFIRNSGSFRFFYNQSVCAALSCLQTTLRETRPSRGKFYFQSLICVKTTRTAQGRATYVGFTGFKSYIGDSLLAFGL